MSASADAQALVADAIPAHRYRAYARPDRRAFLLARWTGDGAWVPDAAAALGIQEGSLGLYHLLDAEDMILTVCWNTGRVFLYPVVESENPPEGTWISNETIRDITSDELETILDPPEPPGLMSALSLPPPPPSRWTLPVIDWSSLATPILFEPTQSSLAAFSLLLEAAAGSWPEPSAPPAPAAPAPLPKHIATIVLERAVADGALCPITMEPITLANGAVSSCGHVFQAAALKEWLSGGAHTTCPECRQPCTL